MYLLIITRPLCGNPIIYIINIIRCHMLTLPLQVIYHGNQSAAAAAAASAAQNLNSRRTLEQMPPTVL